MLNKNKIDRIERLKNKLELYGYDKTKSYIEKFYNPICTTFINELEEKKLNNSLYYEIGIIDTLYYKNIKFSLYKRLKFEIKNRIIKLIMKLNIKKLEKDKKDNLSDFLKSIRNKELKNRNIKWWFK